MSYAIFRVEGIKTLKDLGQISAHNRRDKKSYQSNPDIDINKSKDNITLIECPNKYITEYMKMIKPYKDQHDLKQETEREDRKRTFNEMLDKSNSVVADELLFTSDNDFFNGMNKEDIIKWSNTCLDFVYNNLGYKREQILHATIHMDEKTPHLHCVVVPLVKKYDERSKCEKYTISKKQYIKDNIHLSELQDQYCNLMNEKGFMLERGIKNSDNEHIAIKEYKRLTRKISNEVEKKNNRLNEVIKDFEDKAELADETLVDNEYIKIKKDTFDSMKKVIKETKKVADMAPKVQSLMGEVDNYSKSYQTIESENKHLNKEVDKLKEQNDKLRMVQRALNSFLEYTLDLLKKVFRRLLMIGNDRDKELVSEESKYIYSQDFFNKKDMVDISKGTDSQKEIFNYIEYKDKRDDMEL